MDPDSNSSLDQANNQLNHPNNFKTRKVMIEFPFIPHSPEKFLARRVVKAAKKKYSGILQVPEETCKTATLLCSTLAWLKSCRQKAARIGVPQDFDTANSQYEKNTTTIIYACRTHVQTAAVIEELNATNYNGLPTVVLGSRTKLCINQNARSQVIDDRSLSLDQVCQKMRTNVNQQQQVGNLRCPFYSLNFAFAGALVPMDIEDMKQKGREQGKCPYYASKALQQKASFTVCTYNHLVDPYIRMKSKIYLENAVVILDDAEEVKKFCKDDASGKVTLEHVRQIISNLKAFKSASGALFPRRFRSPWRNILSKLRRLRQFLHDLEQEPGQNLEFGSIDVISLSLTYVERFEAYNWSREDVRILQTDYETLKNAEHESDFQVTKVIDEVATLATIFSYVYEDRVHRGTAEWTSPNYIIDFKRNVNEDGNFSNAELHFACNHASVAFKKMTENARSVIVVASGTSGPLNLLAAEFGIDFQIQETFDPERDG